MAAISARFFPAGSSRPAWAGATPRLSMRSCAASRGRRSMPSTRADSSTAPASRKSFAAASPCRGPWRPSVLGQLGSEPLERFGLVGELERFVDGDFALLEQPEEAGVQALHA